MLPGQIAQMKIDTVTVKVKVNLPEIDLVVSKIGPLAAGSRVDLERWQAEILGEWGIVEWAEDSESLLLQAYASRDKEQERRTIEAVGDAFQIFPEVVRALGNKGLLSQKTGAVRSLLEDIVSSRTNKIDRVARMGQEPPETLSPEELWLYSSLRKVFNIWRHETGKLIEEEGTDGS